MSTSITECGPLRAGGFIVLVGLAPSEDVFDDNFKFETLQYNINRFAP